MDQSEFLGTTIVDGRQFIAANRKKSCDCPCCGQYTKEYGRSLHASMARVLVALHKYFVADPVVTWLHVSTFPVNGQFNVNGDYNYLRHWGLLQPHPGYSGIWHVADLGHQFVRGEVRVPKRVFLFNNERVGAGDKTISIQEALGNKFDYDALMVEAA